MSSSATPSTASSTAIDRADAAAAALLDEPSRSATTGAIRVERSAGARLAMTVTTVPTSSATMIVRDLMTDPCRAGRRPRP